MRGSIYQLPRGHHYPLPGGYPRLYSSVPQRYYYVSPPYRYMDTKLPGPLDQQDEASPGGQGLLPPSGQYLSSYDPGFQGYSQPMQPQYTQPMVASAHVPSVTIVTQPIATPRPSSYLALAIVTTVCCNPIFGKYSFVLFIFNYGEVSQLE